MTIRRRSITRWALTLVIALGALSSHSRMQSPSPNWEPVGIQPGRDYFSELPFESIDTITGNLVISATDLVINGNAGMSLAVTRSMNYGADTSATTQWTFGLGGLPLALLGTSAPSSGAWNVGVVFGDGTTLFVPHQTGVDTYVLPNFMRVTLSTRSVDFPNGWIGSFETTSSVEEAELLTVTDPYSNQISLTWASRSSGTKRTRVTQADLTGGSDPTRSAVFTYASNNVDVWTVDFKVGSSTVKTWTYTYNSDHTMATAELPTGQTWTYSYASNHFTVETPFGGTVDYYFSNWTDPNSHTHPSITSRVVGGRDVPTGEWTFSFSSRTASPVTADITAPDGRILEYQHFVESEPVGTSWRGEFSKVIKDGTTLYTHERTYTHCSDGTTADGLSVVPDTDTVTHNYHGFTTTYSYHGSGTNLCDFHRPYQVTSSSDWTQTRSQTFAYPPGLWRGDLVASSTLAEGDQSWTTSYGYDSYGFLTSSTTNGVTTSFSPSTAGNLASVTDGNSHATSFTYEKGTLKNTATPLYTISRTINSDGTVATETRNGHTMTMTYDAVGRVTLIESPLRTNRSVDYSTDSIVVTQGSATATTYIDGFGRTTGTTNSAGISTTTTYDSSGRRATQSYPTDGVSSGTDSFTYDALNRLRKITHPDSSEINISYGTYDLNMSVTDERGKTTTQYRGAAVDGQYRTFHTIDADGEDWSYAYQGLGLMSGMWQPSVGGTSMARYFTYEANGRLSSERHPESGVTHYFYDNVGNLSAKRDNRETLLHYAYDANNRLVGIEGADTGPVTIVYDETNDRKTVSNGTVTSVYQYDAEFRLSSRTDTIDGHDFTTTWTYDGRDNVTAVTYPSGRHVYYSYDTANRVTGVTGDSSATYASSLSYHPSGGLAGLTFGNGTTETTTFDSRYRPAHRQSGPSGDRLDLTYGYDVASNVTGITDPRSGYSSGFSYDNLNRLHQITGFGSNTLTYDKLGNRTEESNGGVSSTYGYDTTLQLLSTTTGSTTTNYSYDAAGNMLTDGTNRRYEYTSFNQLKAAHVSGVDSSYGYDSDGARVVKSDAGGTTYTLNGLAEYEVVGGTPRLVREYVYLGSRLLASIGRASATPPTVSVSLTTPLPGQVFDPGQSVVMTASVPYGTSVSSVSFYDNGVLVDTKTSAPWRIARMNLVAGSHNVIARLTTSSGTVASSTPVSFSVTLPTCTVLTMPVDFDGDGKSDPAVWCAAASGGSTFRYLQSGSSYGLATRTLGSTGDIPIPADYDNDGITDPAVYRQSNNTFYVLKSGSSYASASYAEGWSSTDIPIIGDYDGDGIPDLAIYRPSTHYWYMRKSSNGFANVVFIAGWGWAADDMALPGADYDGDGKDEVIIYRPSTSTWYILQSSSGYATAWLPAWGDDGDVPMVGDYDNDGTPDLTSYNPATGQWKVLRAWAGWMFTWTYQFVEPGDVPVAGDYDGDGHLDVVVRHNEYSWMALLSYGWFTSAQQIDWWSDLAPEPEPIIVLSNEPLVPDLALTESSSGDSDETVTYFVGGEPPPPTVTLVADVNGSGSGSVTSSPSGISCSGSLTSCSSGGFSGSVTFTASASSGSTFVGWSGACAGSSSTCTVTAADGLLVVANFVTNFTAVTQYYHLDILGSVRGISNSSGSMIERHDFVSFGADTASLPDAGNDAHRFAGIERDSTGLDAMGARAYDMFKGRFTAVDPIISPDAVQNPQAWNRYQYANNSPLVYVDPTGLQTRCTTPRGAEGICDTTTVTAKLPVDSDWTWTIGAIFRLNRPRPPSPAPEPAPGSDPSGPGGASPTPAPPPLTTPKSSLDQEKERKEKCADSTSGLRGPDFVSVSVSFPIPNPVTLFFAGGNITGTFDRYGYGYISANGVVGFPTAAGVSVMGGWLNTMSTPSASQLGNVLSSWGAGISGGYGVGAGFSGNKAGTATSLGLTTPGGSVYGGYTWSRPALNPTWCK